jgi:two-component system CheB/CheR fusion protein
LKRLSQAEVLEPYLTERLTAAGDVLAVSITSTALVDATGKVYAVATTERAKTDNVTGGSA